MSVYETSRKMTPAEKMGYELGYKQGKADSERHGHWIHDLNNLYGCSECRNRETMPPYRQKNYCPNCGAHMDEKEK